MPSPRVIAITELRGPLEEAARLLAPDLGTTAYELKLALSGGLPAVALMTPDGSRAAAAVDAIVRRGHRAVSCARSDVVSSSGMTALRDFGMDATEVVSNSRAAERLPFSDILALLRASHRTTTVTKTELKERKLRPGMAIATGGLVLTKTTTREVTSKSEDREQVLYLFRRSGGAPWILRERSARYAGLGGDVGRTTLENFATTIRRLCALAPRAVYDERLVTARAVRGVADGVDATDLLAHLIGLDLARDAGHDSS
jgi:hypothetical protein